MRLQRLVLASVATASVALFVGGCGQGAMVQTTAQMRGLMLQRNYPGALATLRQSKEKGFKEQDRVVFWMNEGMLLHLTGQYAESTKVLELAEKRSDELYTMKISKEIKAVLLNDSVKDYPGEDYENVLVNIVKALNFMALANLEGAAIEARKINEKLALYNTKYGGKAVYNQDAFAHWLAGLLQEMQKDYDNARVSYTKSMGAYKNDYAANYGSRVPSFLAEDIARAAQLSSDTATLEKAKGEGATGTSLAALKTGGEIILVHLNGEGPTKTDYFIDCYFASAVNWWCAAEPGGEFMTKKTITIGKGTAIKVAFPQLVIREPQNPSLTMSVAGVTAASEVVEPISNIAVKVLRDKTGRIFKDAIIRVVTKTLLAKGTEAAASKAGAGFGLLAKVGGQVYQQVSEEADKRAWITLPSRIEVARAIVPPGVYSVAIQLPRGGMAPPIPNVKVEAGKRVIISYYTLP